MLKIGDGRIGPNAHIVAVDDSTHHAYFGVIVLSMPNLAVAGRRGLPNKDLPILGCRAVTVHAIH